MEIIRTPDDRFSNLPDFDYQPNYIQIDDTRMHYLDEGQGEVVLCLHGEPSWSFLYRKFIPILSSQYRVIAPDLVGFGRSDKYTGVNDYSFAMHFKKLHSFVDQMGLQEITLVVQDWGGLLGLSLLGESHEKFSRVVIMNSALPIGNRPMPKAFKIWKSFALNVPGLPIGKIMQMATASKLPKEVIKAYQAPFPSKKYKSGAKAFPALVPTKPVDPGVPEMKVARDVLAKWDKPALVMFSDKDPIMRGGDRFFRKLIPGAKEQPEITIENAGHFLQEDKGEEIAGYVKQFMEGSLKVI
ncbi:MAG: haloalkane dehalogenase [Cyclobacteriaceae bacterium]